MRDLITHGGPDTNQAPVTTAWPPRPGANTPDLRTIARANARPAPREGGPRPRPGARLLRGGFRRVRVPTAPGEPGASLERHSSWHPSFLAQCPGPRSAQRSWLAPADWSRPKFGEATDAISQDEQPVVPSILTE
jgi:hypothetical protein